MTVNTVAGGDIAVLREERPSDAYRIANYKRLLLFSHVRYSVPSKVAFASLTLVFAEPQCYLRGHKRNRESQPVAPSSAI